MKLGFVSLGCAKNLVDGEVMLGLAQAAGHEITTDAASADAIVVNTCAFIDKAKEESIDAILEMAQQKRAGGCKTLIVTGCLAERYRSSSRRRFRRSTSCSARAKCRRSSGRSAGPSGRRRRVERLADASSGRAKTRSPVDRGP